MEPIVDAFETTDNTKSRTQVYDLSRSMRQYLKMCEFCLITIVTVLDTAGSSPMYICVTCAKSQFSVTVHQGNIS